MVCWHFVLQLLRVLLLKISDLCLWYKIYWFVNCILIVFIVNFAMHFNVIKFITLSFMSDVDSFLSELESLSLHYVLRIIHPVSFTIFMGLVLLWDLYYISVYSCVWCENVSNFIADLFFQYYLLKSLSLPQWVKMASLSCKRFLYVLRFSFWLSILYQWCMCIFLCLYLLALILELI